MFLLAWGPGVVVGVILYFATGHFYAGVLAFAILCLVMTIVLGAIGAILKKRRERRVRS